MFVHLIPGSYFQKRSPNSWLDNFAKRFRHVTRGLTFPFWTGVEVCCYPGTNFELLYWPKLWIVRYESVTYKDLETVLNKNNETQAEWASMTWNS